jgi:uncharacterized protein
MAKSEFSVPTSDFDASGKRYRFSVQASWLRGAFEGTDVSAAAKDGELDVRLSKSGTDVVVRGTVTAELFVPCARCLEPARVTVKEPLVALLVPAAGARHGAADVEDEPDAGQPDVASYDGETVVLDALVRDELLLGIPMVPLCSDSCPGIRPDNLTESGARAVDPRLRPLMRLKKTQT